MFFACAAPKGTMKSLRPLGFVMVVLERVLRESLRFSRPHCFVPAMWLTAIIPKSHICYSEALDKGQDIARFPKAV